MARNLNRWQGIGRLGSKPEIKYSNNNDAIANFSIACSDDYNDKNTGQKVEQTEWVNISAFGRKAEIIGEYLKKGSKIFAEGKLTTRKYTDGKGIERYATSVKLIDFEILDSRGDSAGTSGGAGVGSSQPMQDGYGSAQTPQAAPNNYIQGMDFDDDVPF